MMIRIKKKVAVIVLCISILVFYMVPLFSVFAVSDAETGKIAAIFNKNIVDSFYIEFEHSVNKTMVREYYQIQEGLLLLKRAEYTSLGVGMPAAPETDGARLYLENGMIVLDDINISSKKVTYRVGTVSGHTLHLNGKARLIKSFLTDKSAFAFSCEKISLFKYLTLRQKGG